MSKIIRIFLMLTVICFLNSHLYAKNPKKLYQEKITIGIVPWPGFAPLILAENKGFFKEQNLNVEIKRYEGLAEISDDYKKQKIQGRANINFEVLKERLDGLDHQIVVAIDYSDGADAIMATQKIREISQLVGKKVSYEAGTLEEFFLTWALNENELRISDIIAVPGNPEQSAKNLASGSVDAAATYEPYLSQYLSSSQFRPIFTSRDAPGLITDVLTFHTAFIKDNPETIEAILKAYFKAYEYIQTHPGDSYSILAAEFKVTPADIEKQFSGVKLLSLGDNKVAFTFAAGLLSLYGNLRQTAKIIYQQPQYAKASINTDNIIERRFVQKMAKEGID